MLKLLLKKLFCKHEWEAKWSVAFTEPPYWYQCKKCGKIRKP